MTRSIEERSINTIRTLTIDAVEKAGIGHPGMPMGAAPMGYTLWTRHMKHNPANPEWFNRDRFVLSAGHGSMLLYSLLHLTGYDVTLEDLKQFRQWGSRTPGHPEFRQTAGVEATTGPLGQGLAMAVGMAMAETHLAAVFNRENFPVVDHHTYVLCGDGDLMEGISAEAVSLAGHLKLGKLIVLYDSNGISLDGDLGMTFSENIQGRFEACGWQYLCVDDQNNVDSITSAIQCAKEEKSRPTLIEVKTTIGFGSPNKAGKGGPGGTHGSPLGQEEVLLTKKTLDWPLEPEFFIPEEVREHFEQVRRVGQAVEAQWEQLCNEYRNAYPELAEQLEQAIHDELPSEWEAGIPTFEVDSPDISTRIASGKVINGLADTLPLLIGGSADLASSNMTTMVRHPAYGPRHYDGRNLWFGVREFAMGAALNGMMLHGGLKVYGGTFLVFSDYLRGAIRLSALMKLPVIYVFTHDSIAVGEDGPTHQPIEQIPSLRLIPGLTLFRPSDANETAEAWRFALNSKTGPFVVVLTRQTLPILPGTQKLAREGLPRGAYILGDPIDELPDIQIVATGSEVSLAMNVRKKLMQEGIKARVISMPSRELFERQSVEYRHTILNPNVQLTVVIEMAHPSGWEGVVGNNSLIFGIREFGASGKADRIVQEYGFTAEAITSKILNSYFDRSSSYQSNTK